MTLPDTPQEAMFGLPAQDIALALIAPYYANKDGPEGRATNHADYADAYREAMGPNGSFEIVDSFSDRQRRPGTRTPGYGGAAIVVLKHKATGRTVVCMAGLESDGRDADGKPKQGAMNDLMQDLVDLTLRELRPQTAALAKVLNDLGPDEQGRKPLIVGHSLAARPVRAMIANGYEGVVFEGRPTSAKELGLIADHAEMTGKTRPTEHQVLYDLKHRCIEIRGASANPWNTHTLPGAPTIAAGSKTYEVSYEAAGVTPTMQKLRDHQVDYAMAAAAGLTANATATLTRVEPQVITPQPKIQPSQRRPVFAP